LYKHRGIKGSSESTGLFIHAVTDWRHLPTFARRFSPSLHCITIHRIKWTMREHCTAVTFEWE